MRRDADTSLVVSSSSTLSERRPDLADEADDFARASLSENTRRAIKADWEVFVAWCAAQGFQAMPASAETVVGFLVDQAKAKKVATLQRYRATIGKLHKVRGFSSPFVDERVKAVLEGIRRKKGVAQERKQPMTIDIAAGVERVRDRALILFGLATSCRGDEICQLDIEDLRWVPEGIIVHIRRSKVDQQGEGRHLGVPRGEDVTKCPVAAIEAWLDTLGSRTGPLFRGLLRNGEPTERRITRWTVNRVVKVVINAAGFDADKFGAHSLRAGYVTEARRVGLSWTEIMEQTGHKRLETVKRYDRGEIDPFRASRVADVFKQKSRGSK